MSKRRGGILGVVRGYDGNNIHEFILREISGRGGEILQEENVILGTNSSAQMDGIDFTNGRVSCSKQRGLSIPQLRRTNGIHAWVMAHAKFVSKDDRNLRDCQCYLNASNYSHEVELNLARRFILRIPEIAEFWRMEAKLLRTHNVQ